MEEEEITLRGLIIEDESYFMFPHLNNPSWLELIQSYTRYISSNYKGLFFYLEYKLCKLYLKEEECDEFIIYNIYLFWTKRKVCVWKKIVPSNIISPDRPLSDNFLFEYMNNNFSQNKY